MIAYVDMLVGMRRQLAFTYVSVPAGARKSFLELAKASRELSNMIATVCNIKVMQNNFWP